MEPNRQTDMRKLLPLLSVVFAVACASGLAQQAVSSQASLLVVHNDWQEQITVYVAVDGTKARRLGEVEMRGSHTFVLGRADMPNESLQLFVQDRLSGLYIFSDVVSAGGVRQNYELSFGPLPTQAFLFPTR